MAERANIMTPKASHDRYCTQPKFHSYEWGSPGDVRRCKHGKLMLAYEVPGTVPPYWRTLHPVAEPITYARARKALTEAQNG